MAEKLIEEYRIKVADIENAKNHEIHEAHLKGRELAKAIHLVLWARRRNRRESITRC